jgi:hypothetical protein
MVTRRLPPPLGVGPPQPLQPTASVHSAGAPGSGVTLDPVWSPDGAYLAYVKAPIALTGGWLSLAWYEAHDLMVGGTRTHTSQRIDAISGASGPIWSRNGE